jgi:D-serine deaminase-like pyridoxal phosphate-dependent protein
MDDIRDDAFAGAALDTLETPRLILDAGRLERNCAAMRERCGALGVMLRPHLKTAKSAEVARIALGGGRAAITVSTLREAEYFARQGYRDILCASGIVPGKFAHAARIQREAGCDLILVTDALDVAEAAARFAQENAATLSFLIEIDCGEHRSGQLPDAPAVVTIARAIAASPHLRLRGVMAHAGHSYGAAEPSAVVPIAAAERDAAVHAATAIRAAGLPCDIVSIGSTPTVLMADHLTGVTEARAGIYMVWDLAQLSRKMCREEDIAVSVLASVIGHTRHANTIILDAGALALSKDIGANKLLPDSGYGYLCDARTMRRLGGLAVNGVHQEHGTVLVDDPGWFDRLPVGAQVRVLPNHACITCAGYGAYEVVRDGAVIDRWERINGW